MVSVSLPADLAGDGGASAPLVGLFPMLTLLTVGDAVVLWHRLQAGGECLGDAVAPNSPQLPAVLQENWDMILVCLVENGCQPLPTRLLLTLLVARFCSDYDPFNEGNGSRLTNR